MNLILGDRNVLHSIMSQIDVYNRPFPSPDHTYAISPVKEEKEEIKTEPLDEEDDDEATPTYRNRVGNCGYLICVFTIVLLF